MSYEDLLGNENSEDEQIKKNLGFKEEAVTYVGIIGDHSGSMGEVIDEGKLKSELAKSNFNEQLATLKKESEEGMETLVTVIEFDNEIICTHDNVPVEEIEPLKEYWTRGMTSLYDSIAYGINRIKSRMEADSRDNKAALIIVETDGYENSSSDYHGEEGRQRLRDLIKELEATGRWTFTFLGAGLEKEFAASMGFMAGNVRSVQSGNLADTVHAYSVQNVATKNFMSDRKKGILSKSDFYEEDVDNGTTDDWKSCGSKCAK